MIRLKREAKCLSIGADTVSSWWHYPCCEHGQVIATSMDAGDIYVDLKVPMREGVLYDPVLNWGISALPVPSLHGQMPQAHTASRTQSVVSRPPRLSRTSRPSHSCSPSWGTPNAPQSYPSSHLLLGSRPVPQDRLHWFEI